MRALITTGTYQTSDYKIIKEYSTDRGVKNFLKNHGCPYPYEGEIRLSWNYFGIKYTLSVY